MKIFILLSIVLGFFFTSIEVSQGANLAIRKSGPSSANPGELITYTITYSNTVSTLESNVVITDYLPDAANYTYYSSFPSGIYNTVSNTITWSSTQISGLATLDAGSGENTIQVTLRVGKLGTGLNQSTEGYYLNASSVNLNSNADIKSDQTTTPVSSNSVSTVVNYDCTFKISQPGAGIKSATGSTLTYLVALTNTGNIYQKYSLNSTLYSGQLLEQFILDLNGGAISETPFVAPGGTYFLHYVLKTPEHDGTKPDEYTETKITATPNVCGVPHEAIYSTYIYGGAYSNYKLLSVYKIDTSDPIQSGSQLTYQIVISNVGNSLDNVRLEEIYPANTSFVSASTPTPSVTTGNNIWDFATLPSGNTIITVTLDVANDLPNGTTLSNRVEVSNNGTIYDTYTETTTVSSAPDLSITKTASVVNPPAAPNSVVNYTLTYINHGNYTASGIVIKDNYAETYMTAHSIGAGIDAGGEIRWNIPGSLAPGESGTLHYSMQITDDPLLFQNGSTNIINSAVISSNLPDSNISDNNASATVNVFVLPDLKIEKTADPAIGLANQPITYTLTVSNIGRLNHSGSTYTVVDHLPAGAAYLSSTPSGGIYNAGTVSWTMSDDLPVDETRNFTVTLDALPCSFVGIGTLTNNASVNSTLYSDADNSNNEVVLITDVVDNEIPTIASTDPVSVNNDSGKCSAEVTLTVPVTADNCEILSVTNDHASTTFPVGTTTVKWSVTDIHGNVATADQNVIVNDVSAPVADMEPLTTITGDCSVIVPVPTATDNCEGVILGTTEDVLIYSAQGTYTIDWTYDDGNGNISTQSQAVVVKDITAPVADVDLLPNLTGQNIVTAPVPTATDNCSGLILGTTTDPLTYTEQGTYTIHWTYDDGNNNTSTQTQTVVVEDTTAPETPILADVKVGECSGTPDAPSTTDDSSGVITGTTSTEFPITTQGITVVEWSFDDGYGNIITAQQNVIVDDTTGPVADVENLPTLTGECSVTVTAPTATDNCKGTIVGTTEDPTTYSIQGTYSIHWTYNDGNGNTLTQSQTVVVDDISAPVADIENLPTLTGECSVTVTAPTATDICAGTLTGTTEDALTYTTQGTYTIHWTYDDGNGNTSTQSQTVVVNDITPPETPVLADVILGECSGTPPTPTTVDNCAGIVMGKTSIIFPKTKQGKHTIIWTFDDGNGNVTSAYQNLIVDDITAPVADMASLPIITGECEITVTAPTATDNCKGTIVGTTEDPTTYSIQGTYTIHWTYDDGNGNTSTQSQTVVVDDMTPPETPVLADVILGECSGTPPTPTTVDNCAGIVIGKTSTIFPKTKQGKHTIIWTFDDGNGNVTSAYQNLIVDDITAPVADMASLPIITGECEVTVTAPTATDNCKGTIVGTTENPTTYSIQGTYTIHWTYDDGNGNTSTQSQTVVVDDMTPPEITGVIAVTSVEGCDLNDVTPAANTVEGLEALGLSVNDACTSKTALNISSNDVVTGTMPLVVTRTYTISDANNNSVNYSQTILLADTQKPTIICVESKDVRVDLGKCTASGLVLGSPITSDNCSVVSIINDAPEIFPIGSTTVLWTVTDASGNIATCSQVVTVKGSPVAVDDVVFLKEDFQVSGNVMVNDLGLCNATVQVKSHTEPAYGDLSIAENGNYTYIPEENYHGTDQFTYQICNSEGECSEATVTITVENVNDLPIATEDKHSIQLDLVLQGDVADNDMMSGDGVNVWTIVDQPAHGTILFHPDGTYTYTPSADFLGSDSFTYKLCDADGDCSQAKVSIRIEDVLLPNQILTPNGDDVNDTFIIVGINLYPQNKLTMYNRWGNVVYQKNNYQNEWDGNSNVSKIGSKSLPVGTYYYLIDYGKGRHKTGFVYLDR